MNASRSFFAFFISLLHFIQSGATKIVNWYDIAGVYPIEPYAEDPATVLAHWPWSGHYKIREALWGYAHYGQFSKTGWLYLNGGSGNLTSGGTFVTLKSPDGGDYSIILETKGAKTAQQVRFLISGSLSAKELCLWRSNEKEQFVQQEGIKPVNGSFTITLESNSVAEQQAIIRAQKDDSEGDEKMLGAVQLPNIGPNQWHNLKLRFEGSVITGLVDGKPVLKVIDSLYSHGMAGLMAGGGNKKLSMPFYDNLLIKGVNAPVPRPSLPAPGHTPIYLHKVK